MRARRRAGVTAVALAVVATGCGATEASQPLCRGSDAALILMAQAVPSASLVPCLSELPAGWSFGGEHIESGRAEFWLNSDRAGIHAVQVILDESCDTTGALPVPVDPDEVGTKRYEAPRRLPPSYVADRFYVFRGGCVTYSFRFSPGASFTLALEASHALSFYSRADGVRRLRRHGFDLCGAGVDCPG